MTVRSGVTQWLRQEVRDGVAAWHRSHYDIQADALARAVDHPTPGESV